MKAVKNVDIHDIDVPFDGYTYSFPKEKIVAIDEKVYDFINERFPMSFSWDIKVDKKQPVAQVHKTKTKAFIPVSKDNTFGKSDMLIESPVEENTFGGADITPMNGKTDGDGVGWYGPGIEIEGA